jgi:Protein kinase domain
VLGREPHGVVAELGRGVSGDAGRCAAFDETPSAVGQLPSCAREVAVVAQEASEDELPLRPSCERLRECEQPVEAGSITCDYQDRALLRGEGICLRRQSGVLVEDRLLELVEGGARLDAQLLHQQTPRLPVDLERLRLPSGAVQREHELRPRPLAERMLADEGLELRDELGGAPECEVSVDASLERDEPQLLETKDLRLRERLVRDVGERRAAPESECLTENSFGGFGRRPLSLLDQVLEAEQVELEGPDSDHVAGLAGDDRVTRGEQLAEPGHVVLQRVASRFGSSFPPQLFDQPVGRDDLVRAGEQQGQQRPLPRSAERERTALLDDLERSQDPELHVSSPAATLAPRVLSWTSAMPQQRCGQCQGLLWYARGRGRIVLHKVEAVSTQAQIGIGSDFLGYRIEELVGRGGMGVVYRAYDMRLKRTVALKLVTPELALDQHFKERFTRETELTMALEHPNAVPIHDAGDVDGHLYLAMRLVEGTDLRRLLEKEGALEPSRALAICGQVANALDAAHGKGLVHRDVKPSNVLLDANEHVYLADFGLTRRLEEEGVQAGEGRSVGTPAYLAPEQIEGKPVDGRADVYSLGCVLFECLTGSVPYRRTSRLAAAWAHLEEEPPTASEFGSELPAAIDAVIQRALAKEPEDRYPTCAALIAAAEEALGLRQRPILRRRTLLLIASIAIVATLAAALVVALVPREDEAKTVPIVRENSLVRIDPATNAISAVTDVGRSPMAAAVGGGSVWVYNHLDRTVSEIDAATNEVRQTTRLSARPVDLGRLTGPVLAADEDGAWIVGVDDKGRSLLTRVLSGGRGARAYPLDREPRAVAVGEGAVWVLGAGKRESQVLRVDPATGEVTARTRFPASSRISSLEVGLGRVWVVSSSTAVLYRIHPLSAAVTGRIDLGQRAGRPSVEFGIVYVGVSDPGRHSLVVDPRTLGIVKEQPCCPLRDGYDIDYGHGSEWMTDWPTGAVHRFAFSNRWGYSLDEVIAVASPPGFYGGVCLTSLVAGAGAVWVTLAPSGGPTCS